MNKSFIQVTIALFALIILIGCTKEYFEYTPSILSITNPQDGEEIRQGEIVYISVNVSREDSSNTHGEYVYDGVYFHVDSSLFRYYEAPFPINIEWNTFGEDTGSHTIQIIRKPVLAVSDKNEIIRINNKDEITVVLTEPKGTFIDSRDGRTYKWAGIGEQVWMAENLNYETSSGSWVYNDSIEYAEEYGRLYDWETAKDACPDGWHLPGDDEWKRLEMTLGMSQYDADQRDFRGKDEGKRLKSTSGWDSYWYSPYERYLPGNGSDDYGFSALPGGSRFDTGTFWNEGIRAQYWTSSVYIYFGDSTNSAWYRGFFNDDDEVYRGRSNKLTGFSVRCVRD